MVRVARMRAARLGIGAVVVLGVLGACKKPRKTPPSPLQDAAIHAVPVDGEVAIDAAVAVEQAPVATKVVVGAHAACALLSNATVRCWGRNELGQLGDGTQVDSARPVAPKLRGVEDLVMSDDHACALLDDTSVACWGKIGYGDAAHLVEPTAVPGVRGVVRIFAIGGAGCATEKDGALVCWGDVDTRGHITTTGAHHAPTPVPGVDHAIALVARGALREDGEVLTWLDGGAPVHTLAKMVELAARDDLVCALDGDGVTSCIGSPACGPIKPAKAAPRRPRPKHRGKLKTRPKHGKKPKPAPVAAPAKPEPPKVAAFTLPLPKAKHLAFDTGVCVVTTGKQLVCADLANRCAPVRPWPAMVTIVAMSGACGQLANGTVRCGVAGSPAAPLIAKVAGATQLSATATHGCVLEKDRVACWEATSAAAPIAW
jgi:Regulator of chromosome condensation (RCC1) repeat